VPEVIEESISTESVCDKGVRSVIIKKCRIKAQIIRTSIELSIINRLYF